MARPKKQIDEETVRKLGQIMCTNEEIAAFFHVSKDTIERRFAAILKEAREIGRMSLRRFQYQAAEKGNTALLIWLGKQYLGQSEKQEIKTEHLQPIEIVYNPKTLKDKE